jgi:hypothetical protein
MSQVQSSVKLKWKPYSVDLLTIEAHIKSNWAADGYCGMSAGDELTLWFTTQISDADQVAIETYWDSIGSDSPEATNYTANKTAAQYHAQATAAIAFGQNMMAQFAGQNLQLGITAAGKTKFVRQTMQEVTNCLTTGSLIEAIAEIKAIPQASYDSTFITAARLLSACNQLEAACGLSLSSSLS